MLQQLSHLWGYAPDADKPVDAGNCRNGVGGKTVLTEEWQLPFEWSVSPTCEWQLLVD
jgi:hypothetical protein